MTARKPRVSELVHVAWDLPESSPSSRAWESLVAEAERTGIVREHDDGGGRCMWYNARRGGAERSLRARCEAVLGAPPARVEVPGLVGEVA